MIGRVLNRTREVALDARVQTAPPLALPLPPLDVLSSWVPPRLSEIEDAATVATCRFASIAAIETRLGRAAAAIRVVAGPRTPQSDSDLLAFGRSVLLWRRLLGPHEALWWIQRRSDAMTMTLDEAEQLLGLAAGIDVLEEDRTPDGALCFVIGGPVARCSVGFALHWSRPTLENSSGMASFCSRLTAMSRAVAEGIHFVELPAGREVPQAWKSGVEHLCRQLVAGRADAMLGVYSSAAATDCESAMQTVRDVAGRGGVIDRLSCHRIVGPAALEESAAALERCRRYRLRFDCSLMVDATAARPYLEDRGYVPLEFDPRVPSFIAHGESTVVLPLHAGAALADPRVAWWSQMTITPERAYRSAAISMVEAPARHTYDKLVPTLDRSRRAAYLDRLTREPATVVDWHQYHVYNWAPPAAFVTRLLAFDAGDLAAGGSTLRALAELADRPPIATARRILDEAGAAARAFTAPDLATQRRRQVAAHAYLAAGGREALTADSEALLAALPDRLGATLELGFGYGLTAARLAARATNYVGLDLQVEQGTVFAARGGRGTVGDIHALPFRDGVFDTVIADNVLEHASLPLTVLTEIRRVLAPGGAAYVLIPLDALTSEFQIRTHLWKADESNLRAAAHRTGFVADTLTVLEYGRLGVYGCFPASTGRTCLLVLKPAASAKTVS